MEKSSFQVENGNFTMILNSILDNLFKIPFKGCEFEVAMFIIRKTYGFKKSQDEISLSQFCAGLSRSRPTIVKALKNLQLVQVVLLVKRGGSRKHSNLWRFNKYHPTWKLVKLPELVKHRAPTSKAEGLKLVKVPLHTKENTKENNTKERRAFFLIGKPPTTTDPSARFREARDLVLHCEAQYGIEDGSQIAMQRFITKYGCNEALKYKGIFKL